MNNHLEEVQKKILFIFFQTGNRANGGIISLMEVVNNLQSFVPVFMTQNSSIPWYHFGEKTIITKKLLDTDDSVLTKLLNIFYFNYKVYKVVKAQKIKTVHVNDINALRHSIFG